MNSTRITSNRKILTRVPGGSNYYITGTGALRPCGPPCPGQGHPRAPYHPQQAPGAPHNPQQAFRAPHHTQLAPGPPQQAPSPLLRPPVLPAPGAPALAPTPVPGSHPPAAGVYRSTEFIVTLMTVILL